MSDRALLRDYSRSRAVLMGTWDYAFLPPIPAAENSLRRMARLLSGPLCGWPKERLAVVGNAPGPGEVPDFLITTFEEATDVALFYYVGHGQIDADDQVCLGLRGSRPEPNRRTATSLPFQAVRRALLDSQAATKLIILDCCFAGLANRPASTLSALADDVMDRTAGTGAYTMVASSAYATAWFEDAPGIAHPQTFFTKYFADLIETGVPGLPPGLRLHQVFSQLRENLARDQRPTPDQRSVDSARDFIFARNAAPAHTHHDPAAELDRLARRLAEAEARELALHAEAAERTRELERLRELARRVEASGDSQQQRQLLGAIEEAERKVGETTAAQEAIAAEHQEALVEHSSQTSRHAAGRRHEPLSAYLGRLRRRIAFRPVVAVLTGPGRWLAVVSSLLVLLMIGGFFGWRYVQGQYYVGSDGHQVVIYHGINQKILGISLSSVYRRTGVPLTHVVPNDRQLVVDALIPSSSLTKAESVVTGIRHDYTCEQVNADLAEWAANKPKSDFKIVKKRVNGRIERVRVPVPYRPEPVLPSYC